MVSAANVISSNQIGDKAVERAAGDPLAPFDKRTIDRLPDQVLQGRRVDDGEQFAARIHP